MPLPPDWQVATELKLRDRSLITVGTELKIRGHRGRFRFVKAVTTSSAQWVDVVGGPKGTLVQRSFYVSEIARVHRDRKMPSPSEVRQLMREKRRARNGQG